MAIRRFPDPVYDPSDGRWHFAISPGSAPASTQQACQHLFPSSNASPPVPQAQFQQLVRLAECIRQHGVPNWPDPDPDGSFPLPPSINPKSAAARLRGSPASGICRAAGTSMSTKSRPDLVPGPDAAPAGTAGGEEFASGAPLAPDDAPAATQVGRPVAGRRRGRPTAIAVAGVALAAAAGFAARGLWPGGTHPAVTSAVPVATAMVVRTDLSARQQVAGTLGYGGFFTVRCETDGGLLTWLPPRGTRCTGDTRCSPSTASR